MSYKGYKDFEDYIDCKYWKFSEIMNKYTIFKEKSIMNYLDKYDYLKGDKFEEEVVLIHNNEIYILRKCWVDIIYRKPRDVQDNIIKEINIL